ncbi:sugar ABC transporter permease [Saccharomonospora sp. NPDC046836]|uniref:carbohydrate ABC transporter permease n=1 Tax=Saccharomonospora sp. NPDC046836 TaxID=3156921 RepID=UPI0033C20C3C
MTGTTRPPDEIVQARPGRSPAPPRRPRTSRSGLENRAGYAFLSPWLLGLVGITVGPMLVSLYLSFTDYPILAAPEWIGLDNYRRMLTEDATFLTSLKVTIAYLAFSVPLVVIVALLLALLLNQKVRGISIYRAVFYVPSLIGGSVAIAFLWRWLFESDGILNSILRVVGLESTWSWIGHPDTALSTLVVLNVWQFGAAMIIFLAAIKQIPASLYEAALVDGAGPFRRFFSITLPILTPIIFFNMIMNVIAAFQAFNTAYVVSDGTGGPANSTLFYTLYLYQRGFIDFEMGYASALGWVLFVIIAIVVGIFFATAGRWVYFGDEK